MARKQQAVATTLYEELQASNCVYKSWGSPARGIGPPLVWLGKLLTSIPSRLTLPKLHLATFNSTNPFAVKKETLISLNLIFLFQILKTLHLLLIA